MKRIIKRHRFLRNNPFCVSVLATDKCEQLPSGRLRDKKEKPQSLHWRIKAWPPLLLIHVESLDGVWSLTMDGGRLGLWRGRVFGCISGGSSRDRLDIMEGWLNKCTEKRKLHPSVLRQAGGWRRGGGLRGLFVLSETEQTSTLSYTVSVNQLA